jgi:hypothetical protein
MNSPANLPDLPKAPHSIQLARYSHELLRLSGVLTCVDEPTAELWRRLDLALIFLEMRLSRGRHEPAGKRLNLKGEHARAIADLAAYFSCTRSAIVRQFLRMCPAQSFPEGWVAEDRQMVVERHNYVSQLMAEQLQRGEDAP